VQLVLLEVQARSNHDAGDLPRGECLCRSPYARSALCIVVTQPLLRAVPASPPALPSLTIRKRPPAGCRRPETGATG
jgi:hypothetical protein